MCVLPGGRNYISRAFKTPKAQPASVVGSEQVWNSATLQSKGSSRPGWGKKWQGMLGFCSCICPKDATEQQSGQSG